MAFQKMLNFDNLDVIERDFEELQRPIANNKTNYATHGMHFYPATFIPQFPSFFIPHYTKENDLVVDPMCGAGTTIIEAALQKRKFYGTDIDQIGALISKVATTPMAGFKKESDFSSKIHDLLGKIKILFEKKAYKNIKIPNEIDFPNVEMWFREQTIKELMLIRDQIEHEEMQPFKEFCLLCLSAIVREVSNADPRDIFPQRDKENPIRAKRDVYKEFHDSIWTRAKKVIDFSKRVNNYIDGTVLCADAREIKLKNNTANLIFTSPPYAYAIDYARVQQLSTLLIFMQNEILREYRKKYIGTDRISTKEDIDNYNGIEFAEKSIKDIYLKDKKCAIILHRYFKDMYTITKECFRVLKKKGHLIYVVGNSTIRKTDFSTNEIYQNICDRVGFKIKKVLERPYYVYRMSRKRNEHSNTVKSDFFIIAMKE